MNNLRFVRQYLFVALTLLLVTGDALASGITGTVTVIENKSKGRSYNITVNPDGSFETPELPKGSYTFKCALDASEGAALPATVTLTYQIVGSKEHASGQATGRRVNKIEALVIKQKTVHSSDATSEDIAIDEPGVHLTGKIALKSASGKTMAVDDWTATK